MCLKFVGFRSPDIRKRLPDSGLKWTPNFSHPKQATPVNEFSPHISLIESNLQSIAAQQIQLAFHTTRHIGNRCDVCNLATDAGEFTIPFQEQRAKTTEDFQAFKQNGRVVIAKVFGLQILNEIEAKFPNPVEVFGSRGQDN